MLQKQFEKFNDEIKIDTESGILRKKRDMFKSDFKEFFPSECEEIGLEIKQSDIEFVAQGSFKLGTTVKSLDRTTDLDLGVIIPVDINVFNQPIEIKKAAKKAIEIENRRVPIIKEPCITVQYVEDGEVRLHLDFPIYGKSGNQLYLSRGKEGSAGEWEVADPHGLNEYLLDKLNGNNQLRRLIRYVKRWKQVAYSANDATDKRPPNIGLTLMVANDYSFGESSDLLVLRNALKAIKDRFIVTTDVYGIVTKANITQYLPVAPYTDVFSKFEGYPTRGVTFYNKICSAVSNLDKALECDNEHDAAKYVAKVLGEDFEIPEKEVKYNEGMPKGEKRFG